MRSRLPLAAWAGLTVAVVALQHLSNRVLRDPGYLWGRWHGARFYLEGLVQYDGHRYLAIAAEGYSYDPGVQSPIAWFPLYPLLIRGFDRLGVEPVVAGVAVTALGCVAALLLYWRWLGLHGSTGSTRGVAFLALALYPYAFFLYGTVYADAVFLAAALGAFLLVERGSPVLGGLAGAAATACRPSGMALVPALLALQMVRDGVLVRPAAPPEGWWGRAVDWLEAPTSLDRSKLRPRALAPLLSLGGVAAYAAYLWYRFGEPFAFLTNQATFHGRFPLLKLTFFSRVVHAPETPVHSATLVLQAALTAGALLAVGRVARRFGFAYALLVLGTVTMVMLGTHDFMGAGRYLLLAFPALAVAGEALAERPPAARAVLSVSGVVLLVMAFGFARGRYLG